MTLIRRTAVTLAASAALLAPAVATAPEASARPVLDEPRYCGPGYYPHADYGYCKPKAMQLPRPEEADIGSIAAAGLGVLWLILSVLP